MRTITRLASAAAVLALALPGAACLTPDQIAALQKDVSDMRGQLDALRKENRETAASVEAMKTSVLSGADGGRERAAETKRQIEAIRDDIRSLDSRLDELQHALSGLPPTYRGGGPRVPAASPAPSDPAAAAAPERGAQEVPPVVPSAEPGRPAENPEDLFNAAYADYSKGNYAPALLGFDAYLRQDPSSDKADDALYWIGLCHYDQGEYAEAIAQFDRLIQEHPAGDKVPAAHLKKGLSLLEMSRTAQGVVQLQYLVEKFPKSEEARIARDRLREIGVKP